ncbi:ABC transporter transmembrane domain-containing protein [Streptococcus cuniculipharyngis]|uniref:ABC transporter ATP-binding protein n=1 Tax=Streptococcus cuniculipharyngis TaxID=1562651 RepID=A0A5C5SBZ3_9STRE|nr:ABC transporter ATP-binding protein [Streptococcus cuniculipharyngis]TWS96702.1 ABC transporter ATP-binding protein [Streptococcus cuniculipharyngis]
MTFIYQSLRKELINYLLFTLALAIIMTGEAFIFEYIIRVASQKSWADYLLMLVIVLVFLLSQTVIYYLQQALTEKLSKLATARYKERFFQKMSQKPLLDLQKEGKGNWISSLTLQMELLQQSYFYTIFWAGYLVCQLLVATVMAFWLNPLIALMALLLTLPNLLIAILGRQRLEQHQGQLTIANNVYVRQTSDLIEGLEEWKVGQGQEQVNQRFQVENHDLLQKQVKVLRFEQVIAALNQFFSNLLYLGAWIIGAYFIIRGQLALPTLIAFSQLLARISFPIYSSSALIAQYISGRKILHDLEAQLATTEPTGTRKLTNLKRIDLLDYQFQNKAPLQVSFEAGKKYLLIGPSGSGKTSLLRHMLKLADNYDGDILINGQPLESWEDKSLYQHIHYLPQFPHIFAATLRDNLTLFQKNMDSDKLCQVLEQVQLKNWAKPDKLDLLLGQGVSNCREANKNG